jgi:hypothetical protein
MEVEMFIWGPTVGPIFHAKRNIRLPKQNFDVLLMDVIYLTMNPSAKPISGYGRTRFAAEYARRSLDAMHGTE